MTDHAGPRRCECHPRNNFWHPPIEVTQFWHPRSGYGARQKRLNWSRGGGKVWNESCWKWFKLLFCNIQMNLFLFGLSKTETGAKTAPRVPKRGYFDGGGCQNLVPEWNSQRRGPAWSVICSFIGLSCFFVMKNYIISKIKRRKKVQSCDIFKLFSGYQIIGIVLFIFRNNYSRKSQILKSLIFWNY